MAHFAKLNENNVVLEVNAVHNNELLNENGQESEAKGVAFLTDWSGGYANWRQTSYNASIRKNYAGVGYTYDSGRDAFIPPKPFASWVLNESTCQWGAPTPMPTDDKRYTWDEPTTSWIETTISRNNMATVNLSGIITPSNVLTASSASRVPLDNYMA